jgi:hypothetical protein
MKLGKPLATGVVEEQRVTVVSTSGSGSGRDAGEVGGVPERDADGLSAVAKVPPVVARR